MELTTMLETIQNLGREAAQVFTVFGAAFALLNCFLGYRLMKVWIGIAGFVLGFVLGFSISMPFIDNAAICAVIGVAVGAGMTVVAFSLYKAGVFLLCVLLALSISYLLIPVEWVAILVGVIVGILVGILAMKFLRYVIIIMTALSGGTGAASTLLPLFGFTAAPILWTVGLLLAAGGVAVQILTTGKHDVDL